MKIIAHISYFILSTALLTGGVQEGIHALQQGDYKTAHNDFLPLAKAGDDKAIITIANFYLNGQGVEQNYPQAFDWYLLAMEKNNIDALSNLAVMFREGLGVDSDQGIAHALASLALNKVEQKESGTAARASRILRKVEMIISDADDTFSKKLQEDGITVEYLRKVKKNPRTKSAAPWLSLSKIFEDIPQKYIKISGKQDPITVEYYDYKMENLGNTAGFSTSPINDTSRLVNNDNTYFLGDHRFQINIPRLSSGKIKIYRTSMQSQTSPGLDFVTRFYDNVGSPALTWNPSLKYDHAAVVSTELPTRALENLDLIKILANMKQQIAAHIPESLVHISQIDGYHGKCVQSIIINQIPNKYFPQSSVHISPLRKGVLSIGISRLFILKGYLIELGTVTSLNKNDEQNLLVNTALRHMDIFMSGITSIQ